MAEARMTVTGRDGSWLHPQRRLFHDSLTFGRRTIDAGGSAAVYSSLGSIVFLAPANDGGPAQ